MEPDNGKESGSGSGKVIPIDKILKHGGGSRIHVQRAALAAENERLRALLHSLKAQLAAAHDDLDKAFERVSDREAGIAWLTADASRILRAINIERVRIHLLARRAKRIEMPEATRAAWDEVEALTSRPLFGGGGHE